MFIYSICLFTVERLRSHWEETNGKVCHRHNQLEDMLLECRQFEEHVAEFDRWIVQVEDEFDSQGDIGHTIPVLEKQLEDHRVSTGFGSCTWCIHCTGCVCYTGCFHSCTNCVVFMSCAECTDVRCTGRDVYGVCYFIGVLCTAYEKYRVWS